MRFVFFHPAYAAGGVQSLINRLAYGLTKAGHEIVIIDSNNGFVRNSVLNSDIIHTFIDIKNLQLFQSDFYTSDIFISFGNFDTDIKVLRIVKIRFFYWQVHPDFLSVVFEMRNKFLPIYFRRYNPFTSFYRNRIYRELLKHSAMSIMSESHLKFAKQKEIAPLNNKIIPIPVDRISDSLVFSSCVESGIINIAYIGRPQRWKIVPLLVLLNEVIVSKVFVQHRLKFHVITTDSSIYAERIQKHFKSLPFDIEYHQELSEKNLEVFLLKKTDVVFSMGTSLLEASKLGVPSVFADACFKDYFPKRYLYRWLFQSSGYNLGNPLYSDKDLLPGLSIGEIIKQIANSKWEVGMKCHKYVVEHHTLDMAVNKLIKFANESSISTSQLYDKVHGFFWLKSLLKSFHKTNK